MSNFENVELMFSRLAALATPTLSRSELAEVQAFIDVGEYGLALETTVDIYAEEKKIASADVTALVERLAAAICVDPAPLVRRLAKSS